MKVLGRKYMLVIGRQQIQGREKGNPDGSKLSKSFGNHTAFQELDQKLVEWKRVNTREEKQLQKERQPLNITLDKKEQEDKKNRERNSI